MSSSRERLVRNEALFREVNEQLREVPDPVDGRVDFLCECSERECTETLPLSPQEYEAVRAESTWFLMAPGHERPEIERVVDESGVFLVVEKLVDGDFLEATDPRGGP